MIPQAPVPISQAPLSQSTLANAIRSTHLPSLFAEDPTRAKRFTAEAAGIVLDYSKNRITPEIWATLLAQAEAAGLSQCIQAFLQGAEVNTTEGRPALHTALRASTARQVLVKGKDVMPMIAAQLAKMQRVVERVHQGEWRGYSGLRITDVVNIGIGGSDLGPRLVTQALTPYHLGRVRCHFIANVDASDSVEVLKPLNPATTLVIVASKSFTTQETLLNAETARQWLLQSAGDAAAVRQHFIAISSQPAKAKAFGIDPDNVFEMWDWVGGRYSLWSTIGMPIAFAVGMEHFRALLAGAEAMDEHFATAPLSANLPVILALLGVAYIDYLGCQTQAIIPYDQYLQLLPSYLQQLDMESNGKSVKQNGQPVSAGTAPIVWGNVGTNGQHAFHQLLHQGTLTVPVDFIIAKHSHHPLPAHQQALFAHCLAQSQALMQGKTVAQAVAELTQQGMAPERAQRLAPHKVIAGNKPSNTLLLEQLTPHSLGALLALYEHKVFVQSVLWDINAFDQWGVELGKQLSGPILQALQEERAPTHALDGSTQALIQRFHAPTRARPSWVILDRDGVINHDSDEYIKSPAQWRAIPGSLEAIAKLNRAGIRVAVATNQSGLARGFFDEATLDAMHAKLHAELAQSQGHIDALAFCPHHPDAQCACRKPEIGLLQQLSTRIGLPLANAVMVGDTYKDLQTAERAGCRRVLVKTGKGERTLAKHPILHQTTPVYADLAEWVRELLGE